MQSREITTILKIVGIRNISDIYFSLFSSTYIKAHSSGCAWLPDCPLQELCHASISIQNFTA